MNFIYNKDKREFNTVISNTRLLCDDAMEITFKIVDNERMIFVPGQFILVKILDTPMVIRAYSVLNYNKEANEITIAIRKVPNGQGTTIIFNEFKVGKKVVIMAPMGEDLKVNKNEEHIVLIAAGIGITPILCILNDLVDSDYKGSIEFLYGSRTEKELFYLEEILEIESKNENVKFVPILSQEDNPKYEKGYINKILDSMNLDGKHIYMCASNVAASSVKETLSQKGFDLSKFSCESA